jgi:hypothetical protein
MKQREYRQFKSRMGMIMSPLTDIVGKSQEEVDQFIEVGNHKRRGQRIKDNDHDLLCKSISNYGNSMLGHITKK